MAYYNTLGDDAAKATLRSAAGLPPLVVSALAATLPGDGTANNPRGGALGADETALRTVLRSGVTFSVPIGGYQIGKIFFIDEGTGYIYCQGTDSLFYKWKMTGTGPNNKVTDNAQVEQWFKGVCTSEIQKKSTTLTQGGGSSSGGGLFGGRAPSSFQKTIEAVAVFGAIGAVGLLVARLLKKRRGR